MPVLIVLVVLVVGLTIGLNSWAKGIGGLTALIYALNAKLFPRWWAAHREDIARRNPGMRLPP